MGWGSGVDLLADVWKTVRTYVPKTKRVRVLVKLIDLFANQDADTFEELIDVFPESKEALIQSGMIDEEYFEDFDE